MPRPARPFSTPRAGLDPLNWSDADAVDATPGEREMRLTSHQGPNSHQGPTIPVQHQPPARWGIPGDPKGQLRGGDGVSDGRYITITRCSLYKSIEIQYDPLDQCIRGRSIKQGTTEGLRRPNHAAPAPTLRMPIWQFDDVSDQATCLPDNHSSWDVMECFPFARRLRRISASCPPSISHLSNYNSN